MTTEPIRFDGQVAIVTGAGHGLGRSYATALASRGAAVVCNDIVSSRAAETAREITAQGGAALAEVSSVATPAGGEAIVAAAVEAFGSIDILINNAGQLRNAAFEDMTVDAFREVIDTHLGGAFYVTQPAYRAMKAAGYGRIVFTSSAAGMFGSAWQANYAAAKAGLVGLCNVVALEGAAYGIKANAIMPMALTGIGADGPPPYAPEQLEATTQALRPLAPFMTVERVTPLVVYLASRRCEESRRIFSVGAGHVTLVFIAASHGWCSPGLAVMTAEQVEANLADACDLGRFVVPEDMNDQLGLITASLAEVLDEANASEL